MPTATKDTIKRLDHESESHEGMWKDKHDQLDSAVKEEAISNKKHKKNKKKRLFTRLSRNRDAVKECQEADEEISIVRPPDVSVSYRPRERAVTKPSVDLVGEGPKKTMKQLWKWLMEEEEEHKIIGVYGRGKVGKTVLMENINNKICEGPESFDIVIWLSVEQGDNMVNRIQQDITYKFDGLELKGDEVSRSKLVLHHLRKLKFLLIFDDVWEFLDLGKIGVPYKKHDGVKGSKVVIITRNENIFKDMGTDVEVEVEPLCEEDAWELLRKTAWGEKRVEGMREGTLRLAKQVVKECGGMPFVLDQIGRAMRDEEDEDAWEPVLVELRRDKFARMEWSPFQLSSDNSQFLVSQQEPWFELGWIRTSFILLLLLMLLAFMVGTILYFS